LVIVVLVIALALAVAAFFLLQDHIVYTDDGKAHVELPWERPTASPVPSEPEGSQPLVIVTQAPADTPVPSAAPTSAPAAEKVDAVMAAETYLTGQALPESVTDGRTAVILDMKGDDGWLRYISRTERAVGLGTNPSVSGRNAAVEAITAAEGRTVARISCFRDNRAPRQNNNMALRSSAGNWLDPEQVRWLDPAVEGTREYLVGLCVDLAELGFDEILLDNAFYPYDGRVGAILYKGDDLPGIIEGFYREVSAALEPYPGVTLSIVTAPEALAAGPETTGQSAQMLAGYADKIYVRTEDRADLDTAVEALTAAGAAEGEIVAYHALSPGAPSLSAPGGEAAYLK